MVWDLPDKRLEERAQLCLERIYVNPDSSFPDIFFTRSELLGFYRFINNEKINYPTLFDSYLEQTRQNCREEDEVLVLHDTTIVKPARSVKGLRPVNKSKSSQGFLSHLSLAVKRSGPRVVLGPSGILNWTRHPRKSHNEHLRWFEQVKKSEECFKSSQAIHIMDREGDSYYNLCQLTESKIRFIIRSCHDRRLGDGQKMMEFISSVSTVAEKTVSLSRRKKSPLKIKGTIHPPREAPESTAPPRKDVIQG
jgi:hypothetical protein